MRVESGVVHDGPYGVGEPSVALSMRRMTAGSMASGDQPVAGLSSSMKSKGFDRRPYALLLCRWW